MPVSSSLSCSTKSDIGIRKSMSEFENYKSRGLFLSPMTLSNSLLLTNNVVFSTA